MHVRIILPTLVAALLLCAPSSLGVVTLFDDGGVHDVDYSAWDNGGTFEVLEGSTLNLLPGSRGDLVARQDSVVNLLGGAVGGRLPAQNVWTAHDVRHQAVLNVYGGTLYRRYINLRNDARMNIFSDVNLDGDPDAGGSSSLNGIDAVQTYNDAIVFIDVLNLNDVEITWQAQSWGVTLWVNDMLLPGGTETKTLRINARGALVLPGDGEYEGMYVLNWDAVNIGGEEIQPGLNIIPEPATLGLLGLGGLAALIRRRRA